MAPPVPPTPPTPAPSLGDATTQVVVLAFDLAGKELPNFDTLLANALQDDKVKEAVSSALSTFMFQRTAAGGTTTMSAKDATDLVKALQNSAGSKVTDALTQQIKNSPEYKRLEDALSKFESAAKSSPMGVWVDRNQGVLIVVGLALVIGTSVALYVTKTGVGAVDFAFSQVTGKPLKIFKIGSLTVQGQLLAFQPATQTVGGGLVLTNQWDKLNVTVKLGVVAAGSQVQKVEGAVVVKSNDMSVSVTGTGDPTQKKFNLGLSVGVDRGPLTNLKLGLGAIITDDKFTGGTVNAGLKTRVGEFGLSGQDDRTGGRPEVKGMATWKVSF